MRRRSAAGFTLLEMMVALAIVSVIIAVSIPYYQRYKANTALRGTVDGIVADLQKARSDNDAYGGNVQPATAVGSGGSTPSAPTPGSDGGGVGMAEPSANEYHTVASSQYSVLRRSAAGATWEEALSRTIPPGIQVTTSGGTNSSALTGSMGTCGSALVFNGPTAIGFGSGGTLAPGPVTITVTNAYNRQMVISVSRLGAISVTEQ